jgi:hypothetical protein
MSRRGGTWEADDPRGSDADNEKRPRKNWWVFPAVAGGLTLLWVVLSLPSTEDTQGESLPYTTKRAGWPDSFSRWSVTKETGETTYSSFSTGALLFDLVTLAIPIIVAWVIIRHLGKTEDEEDEARPRGKGKTRPTPSPRDSYPGGSVQSTGGWG